MSKRFSCPLWPNCGCPDGTIEAFCPGHTIELPEQSIADRACNWLADHPRYAAAIVISLCLAASFFEGTPL